MKEAIPQIWNGYPVVTAARMVEIDRRAITDYGIPALRLMENAGKGVADVAADYIRRASAGTVAGNLVTVCCGKGNNGGDGLVAARHLKELGSEVMVFVAAKRRNAVYSDEVRENMTRAAESGVSIHHISDELIELDVRLRSSAVLIDALLGTGSGGKPMGDVKNMIQRMVKSARPVIAIDVPSGLQPDSGYHHGAIITAAVTCALGLPKTGLLAPHAKRFVGELKVLDIGFPKELLEREFPAAGA